jgi:ABC-type metal ion transport system substrate-binding protein
MGCWKNGKLVAFDDISTEKLTELLRNKKAKIVPSSYAVSLGQDPSKCILLKEEK